MPRIARLVVKGEQAVYHVMSKTALDGYVLGDVAKDYLMGVIKRLSSIYFSEVLGFCVMGNHFHILVRIHTGDAYNDKEIKRRFELYYGTRSKRELSAGQIPLLRRNKKARLRYYRRYLYEKGSLGALDKERKKGFEISSVDRFRHRTRYFSDSGIMGTKAFVNRHYQVFKDHFSAKHEKRPKPITDLEGVFSLKRLPENI
ncbi:MAG: hypothetical protein SV775_12340 [Thermodesulfobacteriota bacterium]|nr:hypothetical protein [Thermodesulfobacteriota bacterium]